MAIVIRKEYNGENIINHVRMGVIERIKKAGIKYCINFYLDNSLYDLVQDARADLIQLKFRIMGDKKRVVSGGLLMQYSREATFSTKWRKMPRPRPKSHKEA